MRASAIGSCRPQGPIGFTASMRCGMGQPQAPAPARAIRQTVLTRSFPHGTLAVLGESLARLTGYPEQNVRFPQAYRLAPRAAVGVLRGARHEVPLLPIGGLAKAEDAPRRIGAQAEWHGLVRVGARHVPTIWRVFCLHRVAMPAAMSPSGSRSPRARSGYQRSWLCTFGSLLPPPFPTVTRSRRPSRKRRPRRAQSPGTGQWPGLDSYIGIPRGRGESP